MQPLEHIKASCERVHIKQFMHRSATRPRSRSASWGRSSRGTSRCSWRRGRSRRPSPLAARLYDCVIVQTDIYIYIHIYIYMYIYIYYTHTHVYIYIYIYIMYDMYSAYSGTAFRTYSVSYGSTYTQSPLEDSRLFGPSPWKILRHYL